MLDDAHVLAYSAVLTWVMVMTAATLRTGWWAGPKGIRLALSNRDAMPEPSPVAARAERAARNMLENLVLFTALVIAARLTGAGLAKVALGAKVFFWARVLYFPVYLAGITVLRTGLWAASVAGMVMIALAML